MKVIVKVEVAFGEKRFGVSSVENNAIEMDEIIKLSEISKEAIGEVNGDISDYDIGDRIEVEI